MYAALHLEDLAALALGVAFIVGWAAVAVIRRGPVRERMLIALGIAAMLGVPLAVVMLVP